MEYWSKNKRESCLLWIALSVYGVNKTVLKQITDNWLIQCYLNDIIAGICFLIICRFLMYSWLRRRMKDCEGIFLVFLAGCYWEFVAPKYIAASVTDVHDLAAYLIGGIIAVLNGKTLKGVRGRMTVKCEKCGCEIDEQAKFCPKCGAKISSEKHCSNCGKLLEEGVRFCSSCGCPVAEEDEPEVQKPASPEPAAQKPEMQKPEAAIRTPETFKDELQELGERDSKSKAVVAVLGTRVFYKYFYPCLRNDEKLLALRNIQSKVLFARYRKEFIALTDKRIIKFEKMQYFKPKVESLFYEEIQKIEADAPSNAVSGTFVGEKVTVHGWKNQVLKVRMVGKGAAREFKMCADEEKLNHGNTLPEGVSTNNSTFSSGKKSRKKGFMIGGAAAVALIVLFLLIGGNAGPELSDYIPLAKADVMKFVEKNEMEEIVKDFMYSDDGLTITLNENGNIDTIILESSEYSLYGIKVGEKFSLNAHGKQLTEHNYGYLGDFEGRTVYGTSSGRLIGLTLDSSDVITRIEFMSTGADELIQGEAEAPEDDMGAEPQSEAENSEISNSTTSEETVYQNTLILPDSDCMYYSEADLQYLSKEELRLARNEIYARHGRKFESEDLNAYFNSQPWYHGYLSADEFDDAVFNGYEKANLDLIKQVESSKPDDGQAVLSSDDIFEEFDINGQAVWARADNGIYMVPELNTAVENGKLILFSYEANTYEYAMYCYCDVEEVFSTENGGLDCRGMLYDYHTGEELGIIQVIWDSVETVDYPEVNVLMGDADIGGSYQYYGLTE